MRLLTTSLVLALALVSLSARAQASASPDVPPAASTDAPVLHPASTETLKPAAPPLSRPYRVAVEAGSGIAFGFAGGGALGLFGLVIACQNPNTADRTCVQGALLGAMAGYLVGVPLGVYLVGNALGGQGKFSWTLLGTFLGEAAGLAMIALAPLNALFILVPGVGGVVGGLLGYELSSHELAAAARLPPTAGREPLALTSSLPFSF